MQFTKFQHMTDEELSLSVYNDDASSAREVELAMRIDDLLSAMGELYDEIAALTAKERNSVDARGTS